jgi:flavorubredoxin
MKRIVKISQKKLEEIIINHLQNDANKSVKEEMPVEELPESPIMVNSKEINFLKDILSKVGHDDENEKTLIANLNNKLGN